MHRHLKPHQFALLFGDPDDRVGQQLFACPRCSVYRGDLKAWLEAAEQCSRCRPALDAYEPFPAGVLECSTCRSAYEEFERWVDQVEHFEPLVAPEWVTAQEFLDEIAALPLDDQLLKIKADLVYQQWGFCQRLLSESWDARLRDPHRSYERAAVAVAVAEQLDEVEYHPQWVADLRAKARAHHANALRLLGDHGRAEREFEKAERWVERGLGQGRSEAVVLSFKASLLLDQYRHLEAEALLERVEQYHLGHGHFHQAGRILLQRAMVSRARDLPREAAKRVEQATELLDADLEPTLVLTALHNRVMYLIDSGQILEARREFNRLPAPEDRLLRLRRFWLEGDLLRVEGDLAGAARRYDDVRVGYLAEGLHYNVALSSLHLAMVAAIEGDHATVRELARDAVVLLTRAGAPQESFAAIRLLVDSVEQNAVSAVLVQQVARRLARLQPSQ